MKVEVQNYHKSINETGFTPEQISVIWDFYVTKSIAKTASQRRLISDFGWKQIPWKQMVKTAGISEKNIKILLANSINNTLSAFDLQIFEGKGEKRKNIPIEIDIPKIVCLTPFKISDEEAPKADFGEAESVLTHIRNSFAHGMTYFFDNKNVLFEDKDQRGNISARMILHRHTLLDWIELIDKDKKFYNI